jgi:hypothetical protein
MAKQTINIGASPNDGTGTPLRTSFDYCNLNFTELYTATGPSGNNIVVPGTATITGALTVDTSTLKVDSTNDRVGIGTATPGVRVDILSDNNTSLAAVLRVNSNNAAVNTSIAYDGIIASGGMTLQAGASNPIIFNTNGANESGRINTTGVYVLKGGTITANGVGVAFPATQVASSDANCLDDYEEGTWTPVFQGTVTNGTYVYSTQVGRYTKVGNLVTVFGHLVIGSITTAATGVMRIGGLPFTTSSVNVYAAGTVGYTDLITISSGTLALSVNTSGVVIDMYRIISGAGVGFITPSDLVANTRINFTATYFV